MSDQMEIVILSAAKNPYPTSSPSREMDASASLRSASA